MTLQPAKVLSSEMAKFSFRFDTLLKLRIADRDERQAQLAEASKAEQILREQSEQSAREMDAIQRQSRQASSPGPIDVDELLGTHRYELVLRTQAHLLQQKTAQVVEEIERRRQALVQANRQVRVLEKLRDKQCTDHQRRQNILEIKQIDEVALLRRDQEMKAE